MDVDLNFVEISETAKLKVAERLKYLEDSYELSCVLPEHRTTKHKISHIVRSFIGPLKGGIDAKQISSEEALEQLAEMYKTLIDIYGEDFMSSGLARFFFNVKGVNYPVLEQ